MGNVKFRPFLVSFLKTVILMFAGVYVLAAPSDLLQGVRFDSLLPVEAGLCVVCSVCLFVWSGRELVMCLRS